MQKDLSLGHDPWSCRLYHMGTSSKRLQETSSRSRQGISFGVTYSTLWGRPQDVILGRPQDVLFQRPKNVGRGRPLDVGRWRPLALHRRPYGDVHRTSFGDVLKTSSGRNFAEWDDFKCNVQEHHFVHFYEVIISCYPNFMTFFYFPFDFVISNNSHCQLMDLFKRKENFKEKVDSDSKWKTEWF